MGFVKCYIKFLMPETIGRTISNSFSLFPNEQIYREFTTSLLSTLGQMKRHITLSEEDNLISIEEQTLLQTANDVMIIHFHFCPIKVNYRKK